MNNNIQISHYETKHLPLFKLNRRSHRPYPSHLNLYPFRQEIHITSDTTNIIPFPLAENLSIRIGLDSLVLGQELFNPGFYKTINVLTDGIVDNSCLSICKTKINMGRHAKIALNELQSILRTMKSSGHIIDAVDWFGAPRRLDEFCIANEEECKYVHLTNTNTYINSETDINQIADEIKRQVSSYLTIRRLKEFLKEAKEYINRPAQP